MFIFKILLTLAFVFVGAAKLFQAKPLKDQFVEFGLTPKYLFVVGALEVSGGICLFFPATQFPAAIGLFVLLLGAISSHLKAKHPFSSFVPALILGIGLIIFLYLVVRS